MYIQISSFIFHFTWAHYFILSCFICINIIFIILWLPTKPSNKVFGLESIEKIIIVFWTIACHEIVLNCELLVCIKEAQSSSLCYTWTSFRDLTTMFDSSLFSSSLFINPHIPFVFPPALLGKHKTTLTEKLYLRNMLQHCPYTSSFLWNNQYIRATLITVHKYFKCQNITRHLYTFHFQAFWTKIYKTKEWWYGQKYFKKLHPDVVIICRARH